MTKTEPQVFENPRRIKAIRLNRQEFLRAVLKISYKKGDGVFLCIDEEQEQLSISTQHSETVTLKCVFAKE